MFNFITRTTIGQRECFVGSDDRALAAAIARYLVAKLDGRGKIVILEGTPASATSRERLEGFHDVLAGCPDIEVLMSLRGEYQRDVARDAFLDAAKQLQGIDAALCANDVMALGVLDALAATGDPGRPLVVGVNAIPEAVAAIAAGRMLATANFDAMTMSSIATEAAVRHLRGEDVPREIIIPVKIVDAANYSAWNLPFEARACPSWQDAHRIALAPVAVDLRRHQATRRAKPRAAVMSGLEGGHLHVGRSRPKHAGCGRAGSGASSRQRGG